MTRRKAGGVGWGQSGAAGSASPLPTPGPGALSSRSSQQSGSWNFSTPREKFLSSQQGDLPGCQDLLPSAVGDRLQLAALWDNGHRKPGSPATHLQVRLLQPVVHQLRVALLLLQLLLQLRDAGLQAPFLLQRQGSVQGAPVSRGPFQEQGTPASRCALLSMSAVSGSPFAAAVGNLVRQLIPLLLGLALGTLGSCQFLP